MKDIISRIVEGEGTDYNKIVILTNYLNAANQNYSKSIISHGVNALRILIREARQKTLSADELETLKAAESALHRHGV